MLNFLNPVSVRLDKDEMQVLEEVYYEAESEILYTGEYGKEVDEAVFEQIIDVTDDLIRIIEKLNQCVNAKRQFLRNYPRFSEVRDNNVDALNKLGNSLNLDRKNSNIARLFGNVTSFVGGVVVVSSAVATALTLGVAAPIAAPLAIAGGAVVASGSATSAGTSVTELILVKKKVETAKTIIDDDKKAIGELISWLSPACELAEALDRINNMDVMRDMMEILREYIHEVIQIKQGQKRSAAIKMMVKAALVFLPADLEIVSGYVATLISMLSAIIMLHERNRLMFDCASLIFKGVLGVLACVDSCVDCGLTVAQMVSVTAVGRNVGKAVLRGSLAAFSMTLDAASIVLTSIDVHNGSKSKEGQQIIELAEKLREQGDELRKVFASLKNEKRRNRREIR